MTPKEKKFALLVATALAAGDQPVLKDCATDAGYSAKTAGPAGCRLMKKPEVVEYVHRFLNSIDDPAAPVDKPDLDTPPELRSVNIKDLAAKLAEETGEKVDTNDPEAALTLIMNYSNLKLAADCAKALLPYRAKKKGAKEDEKKPAKSNVFKPRVVPK